MLAGILTLTGLAIALSALLLVAASMLPGGDDPTESRIHALLPRIQCGQCGYAGCAPYARAIAENAAPINRCPPGGDYTISKLAELLGREVLPMDESLGRASMEHVAVIDEKACIGCTFCARVCPVDAVVGVPQTMHTVLTDHCTGCELCLPPCPVDCIKIVARDA